jgi:neutral ceramidase
MEQSPKKLQVGLSRQIISPPKGIYLIGYGDRVWGNQGIHDDLTATALAIDDGNTRVVIIACDLLAMNEITLNKVNHAVEENLLVCCSHTHSGPIVYAGPKSPRKNKKYVNSLVSRLIEVIEEAAGNLQPAVFYWGKGKVNFAVNRRERKADGKIEIGVNPEGVVDRSIGIVQVKTPEGKSIASLVNLCCHNVVYGPNNHLVSADWAGVMCRRVEGISGVPCIFIQGATGDMNPDHEWGKDDSLAVERIGNRVAESVLVNFQGLTPIVGTPLNFQRFDIWLPLEVEASTTKPPELYKNHLAKSMKIPRFIVDPLLNMRFPWKTTIKNKDGYWSIPMAATILQTGVLTWIGLGAEVFTEIGIKLKETSGSPYTFFSSLTNGCIGYLPTEEEYLLGGYEVDLAPYFYRLPGRLKPSSAGLVMKKVSESLGNKHP